jgi:hypothetical protein
MLFDMPSRKIPKNYRNITGKFASKKSDRLLSYESKLERDFLYLFEFENYIINIVEQPLTLKYKVENCSYRYTPDFYLQTPNNYKDILIEVKYYNELKNSFAQSKAKYRAIIEYSESNNIDFYFYTDRCPYIQNDFYKFNIHFLLNYNDFNSNDYEIIFNSFRPYITIQEILDEYSKNKFEQLRLLNTIWCMLRRQILITDLTQKINTNTKLLQLRDYNDEKYQNHLKGKISKGYLL